MSGSVSATSAGLNVATVATPPGPPFNDRKLRLVVDLPDTAALSANDGWYKVEYEVTNAASGLDDRTTWSVGIRGTPVHLVR